MGPGAPSLEIPAARRPARRMRRTARRRERTCRCGAAAVTLEAEEGVVHVVGGVPAGKAAAAAKNRPGGVRPRPALPMDPRRIAGDTA